MIVRGRRYVYIALALVVAAVAVSMFHWPGGRIGMVAIFAGMIIAPGCLTARLLIKSPFDPWEIYPLSFVLGAGMFSVVGTALFLAQSPIMAALYSMALIAVCLAVLSLKKNTALEMETGWRSENGGLGYIFAVAIVLSVLIALKLGSFRGWAVEWDYYTYITMVRRLATRGVAGNFALSYANEGSDPVHSYNVWALMWAVIGRGAGMDPVRLYVRSAVLTVPAAMLGFYTLARSLFNRPAAMSATVFYFAYHFVAMGFIIVGRTSFYNADPAWLIFFPVTMAMAWRFLEGGGKGTLAATLIGAAGTFAVHPLWGVLAVGGIGLAVVCRIVSVDGVRSRKAQISAMAGLAVLIVPVAWAVGKLVLSPIRETYTDPGGAMIWQVALLIGLPLALFAPSVIGKIKVGRGEVGRSMVLVVTAAVATLPFMVLRLVESRSAREGVRAVAGDYNWYLTDNLFVLHPLRYSLTAPDMDFFPWILLSLLTIPWLYASYRRGSKAALLVLAGMTAIPFVMFHPWLAWVFGKLLHTAYMRRALRFSAMFGAVGVGAAAWAPAGRWGWWSGAAVLSAAITAALLASMYPVHPVYFRGAFLKSCHVIWNSPSDGLFWHPELDTDARADARWDTDEFATLLDKIPEGQTVLSDPFTSYRVTAYRDIYVMARLKPSTGAMDQKQREADSTALMSAGSDTSMVCDLLRRYESRWILLNIDPGYRLVRRIGNDRRVAPLWDASTVSAIMDDRARFRVLGLRKPWALLEATDECAPR